MKTYIENLKAAAQAIRDNGGVAPETIRRVSVQGKQLSEGGHGFKGQRGYALGSRYYATADGILMDSDATAGEKYRRMSDR